MAAAALSSSARRFAHTASRIVTREVIGSHKLTIDGYKQSTKIPRTWCETSKTFEAAGYTWQIEYSPNGYRWGESGDEYISFYLQLLHAEDLENTQPLEFSFTLLDQAGNPVPKYSRSKQTIFEKEESKSRIIGFQDFIKQKDLEESGCIKDDCFTVKCDISVTRDWPEPEGTSPVTVPPSDLHKHLNKLLWEKQGTDVTFDVAGETFHAHMWLLAARSPVFKAAIASTIKDNNSSSMKIDGIEPRVFKAILHFMYTDSLPDDMMQLEQQDTTLVQNLVAAAQRYQLERLKLMCEEALCKRIDVSTVAAILAVAELHHCQDLKAACVEFIGRPGNLKAVMETQGFDKIKAYCPAVLMELVMKQLA